MNESRKTLWIGMSILLVLAGSSGGLQAWRSEMDLGEQLAGSPVELAAREAGVPLLRTGEMKEILARGSHLVLDARSLAEYDQGHLPGAMSLPYTAFEETFPGIAMMMAPADPLVVYCSGLRCDDALLVALRLREAGFVEVTVYLDGWEGWSR